MPSAQRATGRSRRAWRCISFATPLLAAIQAIASREATSLAAKRKSLAEAGPDAPALRAPADLRRVGARRGNCCGQQLDLWPVPSRLALVCGDSRSSDPVIHGEPPARRRPARHRAFRPLCLGECRRGISQGDHRRAGDGAAVAFRAFRHGGGRSELRRGTSDLSAAHAPPAGTRSSPANPGTTQRARLAQGRGTHRRIPDGAAPGVVRYSVTALVTYGLLAVMLSSDTLIAKHYLSSHQAGLYAGVSLAGKIAYFAASSLFVVAFPLFSRQHDQGTDGTGKWILAAFAAQYARPRLRSRLPSRSSPPGWSFPFSASVTGQPRATSRGWLRFSGSTPSASWCLSTCSPASAEASSPCWPRPWSSVRRILLLPLHDDPACWASWRSLSGSCSPEVSY